LIHSLAAAERQTISPLVSYSDDALSQRVVKPQVEHHERKVIRSKSVPDHLEQDAPHLAGLSHAQKASSNNVQRHLFLV
jgi:hypothetical protein